MQVKDAMSSEVAWVRPDVALCDAARRMRDQNVGCLPVAEHDRLVGIITDRDMVCRALAEARPLDATTVGEIMTKGVTCCFDDEPIVAAARLMEQNQIRRLPVINRHHKLVGMLSLADVARHASRELSGEVLESVSKQSATTTAMAAHPGLSDQPGRKPIPRPALDEEPS